MKILILGVNGFIGHHLSRRILDTTDWEVYGMDMQSDRVREFEGQSQFRFFEGDITINHEWVEYHIKKCDLILPLVAIATPATYVSDPLAVPRTADLMLKEGISREDVVATTYSNALSLYAQSGQFNEEDWTRKSEIDESSMFQGNTVLRGQTTVFPDKG